MATYVIHCEKCHKLVLKDERESVGCPPERSGPIEYTGSKMPELNPYTKKFNGLRYYPNVGKYFDSHRDYETYLKSTGREIVTDGSDAWDKGDEEYIGHNLRPGEKRRGKTLYFT